MLNESQLKGIYVPLVAPFLPDGRLDAESYRRYAEKVLAEDIQGVVVNGTTGESPTVSWQEVEELVRATKAVMADIGKRLPVIVGTGTNDTAATVKRTEMAGRLGADAALVVTPYYSRPSQAGAIEHYRHAAASGVPVVAYEIPARTGLRLTADTVATILEADGVIGLKDSSGGTALVTALRGKSPKPVLCGEDLYFRDMLECGASGGILASANIRTADFAAVYRHFIRGETVEAEGLFRSLVPLIELLFKESNPSPLKWLLARQGLLSSDAVRLPLGPISGELRDELERRVADSTAGRRRRL